MVNVSVGNDTPKKKPNTTPTKVVTISLIVSFGFLRIPLHPKRCPCYELRIKRGKKEYNIFPQHKNTSRWFHTCEREFPYQSKSSNFTITKGQAQAETRQAIAFPSTQKLSILTSQSFKSETEPLILKQSILSELKTLHKTCCIDQTPQPYNNTTIRPPNLILATSCSSNVYKALKQHKNSNKLF